MTSKAPKIVQIETRYVETDAINFRDVVQSFTGKNSSTAWIGRTEGSDIKGGIAVTAKPEKIAASNGTKETLLSSMLMNNTSFKDSDRLWFEFPNIEMEDMPWL